MVNAAAPVWSSRLAALVDYAAAKPRVVLLWVLAVHLVVWTLMPMLLAHNLQLDLAEDLAMGREWQLGYWKHPPLPWWTADALYRLTGSIDSVYLLGALSAVVCLYAVWLLGRDIAGGFQALVAVLALEGLHFFNFSVPKFAHDQMQLPFWALTALFFYRALTRERLADWVLAGAALALSFWSKYAAFAFAVSLAAFLLADPKARRTLGTAGPWAMTLTFLVVIAPNLWWLVDNGFGPIHYVEARARTAAHWYQYVLHPLQWTGGQLLILLPMFALLALAFLPTSERAARLPDERSAFARCYVAMLALGPFAVTTAAAAVSGHLPLPMWGYPLWTFVPLAVVLWFGPLEEPGRLRRYALGCLAVFVAFPVAYAAAELFEPLVRDRPKATQFPGRLLAETVTRAWRERYGTPLAYVTGTEFQANLIAVHSPDRPKVMVHGIPARSPWVDLDDVRRRGMLIVWDWDNPGDANLPFWQKAPGFEIRPPLRLPRRVWFARGPLRAEEINYAFVPPQR